MRGSSSNSSKKRRLLLAASTASLLAGGCSVLNDLSGYAGPANASSDDASDARGATDAAPAPTIDATTEAGDGSTATLDAPCATGTKHLFCASFDGASTDDAFDALSPGNGSIGPDDGASVTPMRSLLITHAAGKLAVTPRGQRTIAVSGLDGLRCRMKYRRDLVGGGVLVLFIAEIRTSSGERLFAEIKDGTTEGRVYLESTLADGGVIGDFPVVPTVSVPGTGWATVDWTLDTKMGQSRLKRGDAEIDVRSFTPVPTAKITSVVLTVGLGDFAAPTSPWAVRVDDLVCDAL